ncbi:MAG: ribosome maturation factor RimP [Erysipelotrichaceae bacterium]
MDQISKIKSIIEPALHAREIVLYDLKWVQEGSMKILQVAIMNQDGTMDLDVCAEVSELISPLLDEADVISFEYFLEVCSPGAERELRSLEEVSQAVSQFVFARFHKPVNKLMEVKGYLVKVEDGTLAFEYMDKAVKRKCETSYDNVALIRLAVKI